MSHAEEREVRGPIKREAFALGRIGEIDFQLILAGSPCESLIAKNGRCGSPSIRVLDFDISAITEQVPICGDVCEANSRQRINTDLALIGKTTEIGVNGWGRH